jgi:hypothetical protein
MSEQERRRPGRRPLDPTDRSAPITVRYPTRQLDALYEQARQHRCTVPELIRRRSLAAMRRSDR